MSEFIWDKENYKELTRSWNQAMCSRFETVFSKLHEMEGLTESDLSEKVYQHSQDLMKAWYLEPSPEEGLNNAEFIKKIDDLDELISLIAAMSVYGEMIVPDLIVKSLMKFGQNSMDAMVSEIIKVDFSADSKEDNSEMPDFFKDLSILMGDPSEAEIDSFPICKKSCAQEDEEEIEIDYSRCENQAPKRIAASFLHLIASPVAAVYLPLIMDKTVASETIDINIQEALASYFTQAGQSSPEWLMSWLGNTIENREDLKAHPSVYLAMHAIASGQQQSNQTAVLALLIRCLEYMENKAIGANSLAQLEDPRAIPFLRAWLFTHQNEIDERTWHEFALAIRKLGGKVDPADHPIRFH